MPPAAGCTCDMFLRFLGAAQAFSRKEAVAVHANHRAVHRAACCARRLDDRSSHAVCAALLMMSAVALKFSQALADAGWWPQVHPTPRPGQTRWLMAGRCGTRHPYFYDRCRIREGARCATKMAVWSIPMYGQEQGASQPEPFLPSGIRGNFAHFSTLYPCSIDQELRCTSVVATVLRCTSQPKLHTVVSMSKPSTVDVQI
jgi:hypothetical protein